jgi:hypothetical protein
MLRSAHPGYYIRSVITHFDAMIQAGKIDDALQGLNTSLVAELQYLHTNYKNLKLNGISKEEINMYFDVTNFLWGWASRAKEAGHGWEGFAALEKIMPGDYPEEEEPEIHSIIEDVEEEGEVMSEATEAAGAAQVKGEIEKEVIEEPEEDQLLPLHEVLLKTVLAGSVEKVTNLLLNFRFTSLEMLEALETALSNRCSSKMHHLLERYCATYIGPWQSNVPRALHLSLG